MEQINDMGLVLEGGGMRGIFTIGVLDAFMECGLWFPYVVGVSAGACNGCSYVTRQRGRARFSNVGMVERYGHEYLGLRMLLKTGCIFNVKLLYDDLPNRLWPFDYDRFFTDETLFEMVTTNLLTGKAEYISNQALGGVSESDTVRHRHTMDAILASSSLPYVSKTVDFNGTPMLDGGIVDSIPVERAMQQGYKKNVVVLTRNKGYRKKEKSGCLQRGVTRLLNKTMYGKYPLFCEALNRRGEVYNAQLDLVEKLEERGDVSVIRPERPIEVDRIERNVEKLNRLYDEGVDIGRRFCRDFCAQHHAPASQVSK